VLLQVAWCRPCSRKAYWHLIPDVIAITSEPALGHVLSRQGVTWYTPELPGPPTAQQLAERLGIPQIALTNRRYLGVYETVTPIAVAVDQIEEERRRFNGESGALPPAP